MNTYINSVDLGFDPVKVDKLLTRARREVDEGLLSAVQIAVARHGQIAFSASFGAAEDDSLICIFSATKGITCAAAWLVIQDGLLDTSARVADLIPEFGTNGKEAVTVEQLFTHTAGFPGAPFRPLDWNDKARRLERFAQWRLSFEPGSRFEYHPTSTMWVIAELIERASGMAFTDFVQTRVMNPLGLKSLFVGLPEAENARALPCEHVGENLTPEQYKELGIPVPLVTEVTEEAILGFNKPAVRAVGVPGGGGFANATDLALFYQALLTGEGVWKQATLEDVRRVRTGDLRDPMFRKKANRGLGIVIAGDEDRNYRGFGKTNSALAFGHNGAGGQLAWVDPVSGISLCYLTNGHDRNEMRQGRRGVAIGSIAADTLA